MGKLEYSRPADVGGKGRLLSVTIRIVIVAMLVTAVALLLLAAFTTYGPISDEAAAGCVTAATVISIFVAGFLVSRRGQTRGLIAGAFAGVIYVLLMIIFGSIMFGNFSLGVDTLKTLIQGVVSGALGGVFGVNFRKKSR